MPPESGADSFRFRFAPVFRRQRESLLRQKDAPSLALPTDMSVCLAPLDRGDLIPRLEDQRRPGRLWRLSFAATRGFWYRSVGYSLVLAGATGLSTWVGMRILERAPLGESLYGFAAAFVALNLLAHLASYASNRERAWIAMGVEAYLVGLISRKLIALSALSAARQSSGNLKVLVTSDVKAVGAFLDQLARNVLPTVVSLAVVTPLLIRYAGRAGVIGVLVLLTLIPIAVVLGAWSASLQKRGQAALDDFTSLVGEWVKNVRLIRYLSWDEAFRKDVSLGLRRYLGFSVGQHFLACFIFGFGMTWWMLAVLAVVYFARGSAAGLDLTSFFGSLWLLTYLASYLLHVPNAIRNYGPAAESMRRISEFLGEPERAGDFRPASGALPGGRPVRAILENVSFSYPGGKGALRDLNLNLDLRRRTAVLGEIGSGKTTLLKLLIGEYAPSRGRILIEFENGARGDLWEEAFHHAYRDALAYVPQEPFVASDPFHFNVSLGDELREQDLVQAAYFAELEADLASFPDGIHQEIGEGGVNLSGGQKQRLNLARAFFSRRPVMMLDDTLSAVDGRTEKNLMERLEKGEAGFVLVTHRVAELARVERVLVMKDGEVIEHGSPEELAARPGSAYLRILNAYAGEDAATDAAERGGA